MKKYGLLIAVVLTAGIAFGVTTITYNIPDVYGADLLAALIAQSDAHVRIEITGSQGAGNPDVEDYRAILDFRTPVYDPNVANAMFVKRRIALFADALRIAHQRKLKNDIRETYLEAAPGVDVNEPDPNEMN